jgi:hypothetical protein
MAPEIDLLNLKTEKLDGGLTRITVDVVNKGAIPTQTKVGEKSNWLKNIQVNLVSNGQILSGKANQTIDAIGGYGSKTLTWLIKANGKVTITVQSPQNGTKSLDINL